MFVPIRSGLWHTQFFGFRYRYDDPIVDVHAGRMEDAAL